MARAAHALRPSRRQRCGGAGREYRRYTGLARADPACPDRRRQEINSHHAARQRRQRYRARAGSGGRQHGRRRGGAAASGRHLTEELMPSGCTRGKAGILRNSRTMRAMEAFEYTSTDLSSRFARPRAPRAPRFDAYYSPKHSTIAASRRAPPAGLPNPPSAKPGGSRPEKPPRQPAGGLIRRGIR